MQVIGHRGAAALAPENTIEGFDVALALGVDGIETDIRETSDGELVLIHDRRLDRTTNGIGRVKRVPWSLIKNLDAGAWFNAAYRGARVPRLREVLEHYARRTHWVLEVKEAGTELRILQAVEELGLLGSVTFTSFDLAVLKNLKQAAPGARAGFLAKSAAEDVFRRVVELGLEQFCPPASAVSRALVCTWKRLGLEVRVWRVRTMDDMEAAIAAGADGATVDFPHLVLNALGRARTLDSDRLAARTKP